MTVAFTSSFYSNRTGSETKEFVARPDWGSISVSSVDVQKDEERKPEPRSGPSVFLLHFVRIRTLVPLSSGFYSP